MCFSLISVQKTIITINGSYYKKQRKQQYHIILYLPEVKSKLKMSIHHQVIIPKPLEQNSDNFVTSNLKFKFPLSKFKPSNKCEILFVKRKQP